MIFDSHHRLDFHNVNSMKYIIFFTTMTKINSNGIVLSLNIEPHIEGTLLVLKWVKLRANENEWVCVLSEYSVSILDSTHTQLQLLLRWINLADTVKPFTFFSANSNSYFALSHFVFEQKLLLLELCDLFD